MDTTFFKRCIQTLDKAYYMVSQVEESSIEYDMYRSACVKEFEIILEQAGKLLRKCLKDFAHSPKMVDRMVFKDIFRQAAQHDLLTLGQAERWLEYRDGRNTGTTTTTQLMTMVRSLLNTPCGYCPSL